MNIKTMEDLICENGYCCNCCSDLSLICNRNTRDVGFIAVEDLLNLIEKLKKETALSNSDIVHPTPCDGLNYLKQNITKIMVMR